MAEETSQERTEQPTERKRRQSKEEGIVLRSKDLSTFALISGAGIGLFLTIDNTFEKCSTLFQQIKQISDIKLIEWSMATYCFEQMRLLLKILMPFFLICLICAWISPLIFGGLGFSPQLLSIKFERLNPISGFFRIFSVKSLVELAKSLLKFVVVGACLFTVYSLYFNDILRMSFQDPYVAIHSFYIIAFKAFLFLLLGFIIILMVDLPFQFHQHQNKIKMTKQEVKDELKETDVRPEVKNKLMQIQQEIVNRKMLQKLPEADVVITNPTHFAVALKYSPKKHKAPILLAKGVDHMAEQIKTIAGHHRITVVRIPMLARAIYYNTDYMKEISSRLYEACAQVLAYVFKLKAYRQGKETKPVLPKNLPVPADMIPPAAGPVSEE